LNVYVINAGRLDISDRVSKFREMIARRDEKVQQPAREIFNLLFSSASSQLSGKTTWLIVPDDSLWQLPFQALQLPDNRFVIEEHVVAYAPSLSALFEMSKPRTTARVGRQLTAAFFANPAISKQTAERLSLTATEKLAPSLESEAEVKSLERIYSAAQSKVFIGAQASEEAAKQANGFNVIHFAAPAQLNEANPLYSHVALSQSEENGNEDGLLEAWEMMKLDLKADFVVFSASEAIVRSGGGDGFAGLAWSLFVGGCPVVVASRWRADGPATNALMTEFHRELQFSRGRQRLTSKAQALQRATLALLNRSNYREPYYWAGFVVMDRK
jgi:CHAT domain-containing protein